MACYEEVCVVFRIFIKELYCKGTIRGHYIEVYRDDKGILLFVISSDPRRQLQDEKTELARHRLQLDLHDRVQRAACP